VSAHKARGAQPGNANAEKHGFYSPHFTPAELARVAEFVRNPSLDDEIFMLRTLNSRVLQLTQALPQTEQREILDIMIRSTGRIAKLLRDKRALTGGSADGFAEHIAAALDEIATELGIEV